MSITADEMEHHARRRFEIPDIAEALQGFEHRSEFSNAIQPLLEALNWIGHPRQVIESLPHYCSTIDLSGLRNAMVELHYESKQIEIPLKQLDPRLTPCLYVPKGHPALVVTEREGDDFHVYNCVTCEYEILHRPNLKGEAYFFTRIEPDDSGRRKNWFVELFSRFHTLIYQLLLISLVLNFFVLATPLYIMAVYDQVIASGSLSMLANYSVGIGIAMAGTYVLYDVRNRILAYIGARLDHIVGKVILERLLNLPPSFTESAALGAQVARIKDFDTVRDFFTGPLFSLLFELPFVVLFVFVIWMLGGDLVYVPIAMLFIFALFSAVVEPFIKRAVSKTAQSSSKRQTFQLEALSMLPTLKYTAAEEVWNERYKNISAQATTNGFRATLLTAITNAISDALMTLSGLIIMAYGVHKIFAGEMSVGALIAIMMLVWRVITPVKRVFSSLTKLSQIYASVRQINVLMSLQPERDSDKIIYPVDKFKGSIEFKRVSFRYRPNLPPALMGISVNIEPGEVVCVVGRNGAGKSTFLKMIPQLQIPQAGSVLIDGQDIRQQDSIELRHAVSYMPQSIKFFYGTIAQNLLFANPVATHEDMITVTQKAGCYDEIMQMSAQFETRIHDQGSQEFPAGFLQKLALARTYIKNAGIMLFDEPGNVLDFEADKQFMRAIDGFRHKSTIVIVTHRPGHLTMADRILFLDHGQLLLNGKPEEVLDKIPRDYL